MYVSLGVAFYKILFTNPNDSVIIVPSIIIINILSNVEMKAG
jgi:hypothetical protein